MGVLLGLADWRLETPALAEHIHCVIKKHWKIYLSVSFSRIRPAYKVDTGNFKYLVSDKNLVQMIVAMRLCFADVALVLSTREPAYLRDNLITIGITKMSAGSKTSPGDYAQRENRTENQFDVNGSRSVKEVAEMVKKHGFEPIWKDWDSTFTGI